MYNSLHFEHLTGKAKGSIHNTEARIPESLLTVVPLHGFVCSTHSVLITNMSLMIVLLLRSINGLRDILLPYVGHCIMVSCV